MCFSNVSIRGAGTANPIADGTSNTILFSDAAGGGFGINVGFTLPPTAVTRIADGTSNTIVIGEVTSNNFCLGNVAPLPAAPDIGDGAVNTIVFGDDSSFDICVSNARIGTVADGTSNTLILGDVVPRTCLSDVQVSPAPASVAEPPAMLVLLTALLLAWVGRAARQRVLAPRPCLSQA